MKRHRMNEIIKKVLILAVLLPGLAIAEDIEVYFQKNPEKINLMFVLDSSETMRRCHNLLIDPISCSERNYGPARLDVLKNSMKEVIDYMAIENKDIRVGLTALTGSTSTVLETEDEIEVGGGNSLSSNSAGGYILYPLSRLGDEERKGQVSSNVEVTTVEITSGDDIATQKWDDSYKTANKNDFAGNWEGNRNNYLTVINASRIRIPSANNKTEVSAFNFRNIEVPKGVVVTNAVLSVTRKNAEGLFGWANRTRGDSLSLSPFYSVGENSLNFKYQDIIVTRDWQPSLFESFSNNVANTFNPIEVKDISVSGSNKQYTLNVKQIVQAAVNEHAWCGNNDLALAFRNNASNDASFMTIGTGGPGNNGEIPSLTITYRYPTKEEIENGTVSIQNTCSVVEKKIHASQDVALEEGINNKNNTKVKTTEKERIDENADRITASSGNYISNPVEIGSENNNILAFRFFGFGLSEGDMVRKAILKLPTKSILIDNKNYTFKFHPLNNSSSFQSTFWAERDAEERGDIFESSDVSIWHDESREDVEYLINKSPDGSYFNGRKLRKSKEDYATTLDKISGVFGGLKNNGWIELDITEMAQAQLCRFDDEDAQKVKGCATNEIAFALNTIHQGLNKNGSKQAIAIEIFDPKKEEDYFVPTLELTVSTKDLSRFQSTQADKLKRVIEQLTYTGSLAYKPMDTAYLETARYLLGGGVYFGNGKNDLNDAGLIRNRALSHPFSYHVEKKRPVRSDYKWYEGLTYLRDLAGWRKLDKEYVNEDNVGAKSDGSYFISNLSGKKNHEIKTCEKNAIIMVTDGRFKTQSRSKMPGLLRDEPFNFDESVDQSACDVGFFPGLGQALDPLGLFSESFGDKAPYQCSALLAKHLANKGGTQNKKNNAITTHMVAFKLNDSNNKRNAETFQAMNLVAKAGNGIAVRADTNEDLKEALMKIINAVAFDNASMAAPGIAVDQSTRLEHLDDVIYGLFKPKNLAVWPGNIKKYKLGGTFDKPLILDQNNQAAIDDSTGLFLDNASSYWSDVQDADGAITPFQDGNEVEEGGARSRLEYNERKLFVSNGISLLPSSNTSAIVPQTNYSKLKIIDNNLGFSDVFDTSKCSTEASKYLDFCSKEYQEKRIENIRNWLKKAWGDVLHSEPQIINYSYSKESKEQGNVIYVSDNNGILHAIDAASGVELFAFSPKEEIKKAAHRYDAERMNSPLMLKTEDIFFDDAGFSPLGNLRDSDASKFNGYGLDSTWTFWRVTGTDNASAKNVYAFGGQRRGGNNYYALDVSKPGFDGNPEPKIMWQINNETMGFDRLGQTWSEPQLAKIRADIGTASNPDQKDIPVLVFAGGYDKEANDNQADPSSATSGNDIYIVNAFTGALIWRASQESNAADILKYSIPATPAVIDVDGDGYFDHIYVGDMGGQLLRVDINTKGSKIADVVQKVVKVADLGASTNGEDSRRFYSTPAVAMGSDGNSSALQIVIGSGYRAHPLSLTAQERVYGIFDAAALGNAQDETIKHEHIVNASTIKSGSSQDEIDGYANSLGESKGWFIDLEANLGEKSLSEAQIIDGKVFFTTYTAERNELSDACNVIIGKSRLYAVNLNDGLAVEDSGFTGGGGRYKDLNIVGIPPKPQILLTEKKRLDANDNPVQGACNRTLTGLVGTELFEIKANNLCGLQRTGWFEASEEKADELLGIEKASKEGGAE